MICNNIKFCKFCGALEYPYECCYWDNFILNKKCPLLNIIYDQYCPAIYYDRFIDYYNKYLNSESKLDPNFQLKNAASDLPISCIPEVRLFRKEEYESLKLIKEKNIPLISISLNHIFKNQYLDINNKLKNNTINNYLKYDGNILLTTDIPDLLCNGIIKNFKTFIKIINQLKPTFLTTPDTYTYSNLPSVISQIKIWEIINSTSMWNDFDTKLIGLCLGSNSFQIYNYAYFLKKIGIKIIAYPSYELRRDKMDNLLQKRIDLLRNKLKVKVLALSCSPSHRSRIIYSDFYSGWSWFSSKSLHPTRDRKMRLTKFISRSRFTSRQEKLS